MPPYSNITLPEDRKETWMKSKEKEQVKDSAAKNAGVVDCKPDYSLIPRAFMDQLAFVMMAGMFKYKRDNYRKGHTSNQLTAAAGRHLKAIESGEDIDVDTTARLRDGCTDIEGVFHKGYGDKAPTIYHWACVAACALMAIVQIAAGVHIDDRYKGEKK